MSDIAADPLFAIPLFSRVGSRNLNHLVLIPFGSRALCPVTPIGILRDPADGWNKFTAVGSGNRVAERSLLQSKVVITGLDPVIHASRDSSPVGGWCLDGRIKSGHDE